MCAIVEQLLEAITEGDRWSMARRTTGRFLGQLLAAGESGDSHPCPRLRDAPRLSLTEHPLAVVDDDIAVVIGTVTTPAERDPIPLVAVLIASNANPRSWRVAALDTTAEIDRDIRVTAVRGADTQSDDTAIIAQYGPLDPNAAAIDWNDPTVVLCTHANGAYTVADALAELEDYDRSAWPWLADEGVTFCGWYLRARHPELVREH
ncbi:hypothetical protein ACGFIU_09200 [Rhodococcus oryzae]|uniref:hypothetical protein n=1 Tax=Rhodococcus oryzae TaxID=2571143 RepID=UPI00371DF02B